MLDPLLLDALRTRFELQGMSIAKLPETIESNILAAGSTLSSILIEGNKIIVLGLDDARPASALMVDELASSSGIERPSLPGLLINNESRDIQGRLIQSLATSGDCLLVVEASNRDNSELIYQFCELALSMNLQVITISPTMQENLAQMDVNSINLNSNSRMDYLCALTVVTMGLVALIDHGLFEQPI